MIKRVLEIGNPSHLKVQNEQLLVRQKDKTITATIPIEDLGIVLLDNSQISVTRKVIEACANNNVAIVHCNSQHLPISMTLPIAAHTLHSKTVQMQAALGLVRKKQLWRQIVKSKIHEQANTLDLFGKNSVPLRAMIKKVKSGDSTNVEAQAAQKYWSKLMGQTFQRDPKQAGFNSMLNYGYAVVRAMIARALVGTGFHLALGINHSSQYNAYCLADDMMEPFRPWVDQIALQLVNQGAPTKLNQENKTRFLSLLSESVVFTNKKMPLMVACGILAADLKSAYKEKQSKLCFPERINI
ncbi:MAG: type II CRISPR-associated endonuclease Cas1 [Candidatus Poribacteria bacterium]|nr:type II CRISPR-associated endonuclease Cas1 [Candidatus Poribacteria bacterium]